MTTQQNMQTLIALVEQSALTQAHEATSALRGAGELQCCEPELKSIEYIYSVRAELAKKRGSPLAGWEQLASGLKQELLTAGPSARARIFYRLPGVLPLVFTNQPATKVLGVLVARTGQIGMKETGELLNDLGHGEK